jgi:hypothetical protein
MVISSYHINTQKIPTFNSNVHFLVLFLGFSIQQKFVMTSYIRFLTSGVDALKATGAALLGKNNQGSMVTLRQSYAVADFSKDIGCPAYH